MLSLYGFGRERLECSEAFCYFKVPSKILELVDFDEEKNIYLDIGMLVVFFLIFRIFGYFILRWKMSKYR